MSAPQQEYLRRLAARQVLLVHQERLHKYISYARLAVVAIGLFAGWLSIYRHLFSAWWLFVFLLPFLTLIAWHDKVEDRRTAAARAVAMYTRTPAATVSTVECRGDGWLTATTRRHKTRPGPAGVSRRACCRCRADSRRPETAAPKVFFRWS